MISEPHTRGSNAVIPNSRASSVFKLLAKTQEHYDVMSNGIMVTTRFKKTDKLAQKLKYGMYGRTQSPL
jgi:hypothetical protein